MKENMKLFVLAKTHNSLLESYRLLKSYNEALKNQVSALEAVIVVQDALIKSLTQEAEELKNQLKENNDVLLSPPPP